MHICFLMPQIEYYSPISGGAVATIAMEFSRELIAQGQQVTVLSPDRGDPLYNVGTVMRIAAPRREEIDPVRRMAYKIRRKVCQWDVPYYPPYLESIRENLRRLDPAPGAVILFNDFTSPRYIKEVLPGAMIYVDLQNQQLGSSRSIAGSRQNVERFFACSGYILDWTVKRYGIAASKISVLYNGVNTETFRPRRDYLEPRVPVRALFVGRVNHDKGPDIAADAVAELQKEGVEIELTVAGGTWFYGHNQQDPYLQSLLKKIGAAGGKYLGHVVRKDIPELLQQHDVAFVPSRWNEPFALTVLEAMASGLAVIASDRGGIPEACGGAGRLVDPDDFTAVVATLRELATNPAVLAEEKMKSVVRAAECTWSRRARDLSMAIQCTGGLRLDGGE